MMKSKWAINVSKNLNANVTSVTNVSQVVMNSSQETVTENAFAIAKVGSRFRSKVDGLVQMTIQFGATVRFHPIGPPTLDLSPVHHRLKNFRMGM